MVFVCVAIEEEDGDGHDDEVGEAIELVETWFECFFDDWMPWAGGVVGSGNPLAEVPGGMNSDGHREASGGEGGDSEEEGAYRCSEEGVEPGVAAGPMFEGEDERDDELGCPGAEGAVQAAEWIATEGEFFAGGEDEIEE